MMNSTTLAAAIKAKAVLKNPDFFNITGVDVDWLFEAVAEATITHIQTFGVVTIASVSGVTTGPGVSGPGTGVIV